MPLKYPSYYGFFYFWLEFSPQYLNALSSFIFLVPKTDLVTTAFYQNAKVVLQYLFVLFDDKSSDVFEALLVMCFWAEVDEVGSETGHHALAERSAVGFSCFSIHRVHHLDRILKLLTLNFVLKIDHAVDISSLQCGKTKLTCSSAGNLVINLTSENKAKTIRFIPAKITSFITQHMSINKNKKTYYSPRSSPSEWRFSCSFELKSLSSWCAVLQAAKTQNKIKDDSLWTRNRCRFGSTWCVTTPPALLRLLLPRTDISTSQTISKRKLKT